MRRRPRLFLHRGSGTSHSSSQSITRQGRLRPGAPREFFQLLKRSPVAGAKEEGEFEI
jgi:hypothetical protein